MKLFLTLVMIGFAAAGYGGIKTYLDTRSRTEALEERGVEADATVESVTEVSGRRIETYHRLDLSYTPPGEQTLYFYEVLDCSGARWEEGLETMRIVYLPDDPEVVRLQRCRSNFDTNVLPGIVGLVFSALALFMAWKSRGMWRS
ncbi:MAG TPA: DUF3592 domain-containing protein [Actinomycetota bacterium]|nr:DUF3592 domain-containing protein [Actinomycetota bacterium]